VTVPRTTTPGDSGRTGGDNSDRNRGSWRDRIDRGSDRTSTPSTPAVAPSTPDRTDRRPARDNSWRSRIRNDEETSRPTDRGNTTTGDSNDVPRRVIDGVGGARVVPRDSDRSGDRDRASGTRDRSSSRDSGSRDRSSGSSGSRDRSSASDRSRDSGSRSSSPPPSNSGNSSSGKSSSGNRESGGKIKRD
jgi:hypothetical protein